MSCHTEMYGMKWIVQNRNSYLEGKKEQRQKAQPGKLFLQIIRTGDVILDSESEFVRRTQSYKIKQWALMQSTTSRDNMAIMKYITQDSPQQFH